MKRKLIMILAMSTIALMGTSVQAGTITKVNLNGNKLMLQQSPINKEGVMYVPVRMFENLGATIGWDGVSQSTTLQLGEKQIHIKVGDGQAIVNGNVTNINGVPFMEQGATYVPLRFVSDIFGATLDVDTSNNIIDMTYVLPTDGTHQYDNFGRIIRTDNLPVNADQYLYIAEGTPNEMYELPLEYELGDFFVEGRHYTRPVNMPSLTQYFRDETVAQWQDQFEEYLDLVLNFDYRNVPTDYAHNVASSYSKDYISYNTQLVQEYIEYAKEKHLVIEGDYYVEPSTTNVLMGAFSQRAWVKFIIKSDNASLGKMFQDSEYELKTNVWYEGYVDLNLGSNNNGSNGTDMVINYNNMTTSVMLQEK